MQSRRDGGPADNLSSPATGGPDDGGVAQLLQEDCPGNFLSIVDRFSKTRKAVIIDHIYFPFVT